MSIIECFTFLCVYMEAEGFRDLLANFYRNYSTITLAILLSQKRFFNQRSAETFEKPFKILGRTYIGSIRYGRTIKGATRNFLRVPAERWLKKLL